MQLSLSEKQRKILSAIEHREREPISVIRKITGYKEHTVRYCINMLIKDGAIVGRAPFINIYPLGYTVFTLFFSLSTAKEKEREQVLQGIIQSKYVSWVAKLGGDYQYGVAVSAKHIEEVLNSFKQFSDKFGAVFFDKSLSVHVRFVAFGRRYLAPTLSKGPVLMHGGYKNIVNIDAVEHKILVGLSNLSYSSHRELSKQLNIPSATLDRRIKDLEEKGIIVGYIYRFNLAALGMQNYRIMIYSRNISASFGERLKRFAETHPHVLHFIECLGSWDYELGVEVKHAENVTEIIKDLYVNFPDDILSIKLVQIFRHLKYSSYPL